LLRVPKMALRRVLGPQMADELVLASQRAVPRVLGESGFAFSHPNASLALSWALALEK
jgi:NAD dependent epimerase/dehydratase family enzyme